jgi:hypothetical protein
MPVDAKVRNALKRKNLKLPARPRVLSIEAEDYVDSMGDDALRIWVVIDEDTTDADINGKDIIQLKGTIHDSLLKHGVTLYPYVFLTKPSERHATDEEE